MAPRDRDPISRRRFLAALVGGSAAVTGGAVLAACGAAPQATAPTSAPPTEVPAATTAPAAPTAAPATAIPPTTAPAAAAATSKLVVMYNRNDFKEEEQQQFEQENPDITIEFLEYDATRFFAMTAAGTPPDILRVQAPDVPQLLARDLLLDLTPYFAGSSLLSLDDLAPANNYYRAESPLQIGSGPIYGMAKDWSPDFSLFIYKTAFEEAGLELPDSTTPLTYVQIAELGAKLKQTEGDRIARWGFGYADEWVDRIWMNMLAEKGVSLYSDDFGSMNLVGNPEARAVVQYFYDLAKANVVSNPVNAGGWIGEEFTKGTLGILQYGYWFSAMAESDVNKDAIAFLPAPTWAGERRNPTITATGTVVTKGSANPDAAWRFFEWYNGGSVALGRFASGWGVPSLKSKYELIPTDSAFQQQANAVLQTELGYSDVPLQFNPYITGATVPPIWTKHLDQALRDSITFDQMLENIEGEVNQAILDGKDRI